MSLSSKAWDRFLNILLRSDMARVNRVEWLTDVLYPFLSITELEQLATEPPHRFLSVKVLNHIANQEIRRHTELLAIGSAGSSLTGCVGTWVGIPTELAQYSVNILLLIQKLAYLYGWDDFFTYGAVTTETRARFTFLMGSMLGIREADELLRSACTLYHGQVSITPMRYLGKESPIDKVIASPRPIRQGWHHRLDRSQGSAHRSHPRSDLLIPPRQALARTSQGAPARPHAGVIFD